MQINEGGTIDKLADIQNTVTCPICNCTFTFSEGEIEIVIEGVPYEKGLRKKLGMNKSYMYHKYISCPWCKSKHKLVYNLLTNVAGTRLPAGEEIWWNK